LTTYGMDDINRVSRKMRGSEAILIVRPAKVMAEQDNPLDCEVRGKVAEKEGAEEEESSIT
jgi:hypothetical protein